MPRSLSVAAAFWVAALAAAPGQAAEVEFLVASTAEMENPHDIKLSPDGAHLFVSDVGFGRVLILDAETLELKASFGEGEQSGTHDVDFDDHGRAYVADTHNGRIAVYAMDGLDAVHSGDLRGPIRGPEGVLVHEGRVYVGAAWSDNLVMYENGIPVKEIPGLSSPHDVERAPDGTIWLADSGNNRLIQFTADLERIRVLEGPPYRFNGVRYLDVMPDGTILAADKNTHRVLVIGPDDAIRLVIGGRPGDGPAFLTTPEGVESRGEELWIADSGNDRIVKFRLRLD